MDRHAAIGGPVDLYYPVTIENPNYNGDVPDPAYNALKAKFPGPNVKFAGLRRIDSPAHAQPVHKNEKVVAARVADAQIHPSAGRFGEMSAAGNAGNSEGLEFGVMAFCTTSTRILLKFDLASLPKETKILGAQVRLTLSRTGGFGGNNTGPGSVIEAYAVRRPWNEVPVDGEGFSCWMGPYFIPNSSAAELWGKEGCDDVLKDRFPNVMAKVDVSGFPAANEAYRFVSMDVTELVEQWRSGKLPNHGVVMVVTNGNHGNFKSSEYGDYPFRPTLMIAYEGPDPKPVYTLLPEEDLDLALAAKKSMRPILVEFYSKQGGGCAAREVAVAQAARYRSLRIPIETQKKIAEKYGVADVPAFLLLSATGSKKAIVKGDTLNSANAFLDALQVDERAMQAVFAEKDLDKACARLAAMMDERIWPDFVERWIVAIEKLAAEKKANDAFIQWIDAQYAKPNREGYATILAKQRLAPAEAARNVTESCDQFGKLMQVYLPPEFVDPWFDKITAWAAEQKQMQLLDVGLAKLVAQQNMLPAHRANVAWRLYRLRGDALLLKNPLTPEDRAQAIRETVAALKAGADPSRMQPTFTELGGKSGLSSVKWAEQLKNELKTSAPIAVSGEQLIYRHLAVTSLFKDWLFLGPLGDVPWEKVVPAGKTAPDFLAKYTVSCGIPPLSLEIAWTRKFNAAAYGEVNLIPLFVRNQYVACYAAATIDVDKDTDAVLLVGTDGGETIWLDGKLVCDQPPVVGRGMAQDRDQIPMKLTAGSHSLVLRVGVAEGGWRMCVRLADPKSLKPLPGVRMRCPDVPR